MPRRLESRHQVNRTQPIHNKITFSSYTRIITHATPSHYITLHPLNVHHTTPSLITLPSSWHSSYLTLPPFITSYRIISSRDDVYWLKGDMLNSQDFNRSNVRDACSVVLLADRENLTVIDQDNLDTGALFAYLALEKHMPKSVFFTIELIFESNISSLNSRSVVGGWCQLLSHSCLMTLIAPTLV